MSFYYLSLVACILYFVILPLDFKLQAKMLNFILNMHENWVNIRFTSLINPLERVYNVCFKLVIQIDQADFTSWMSVLPSALIQRFSTHTLKPFNQHDIA